jgi:hypothetical protein
LLQSLNLSKLKQQNIELSSNIKAVDPPYFPLKPIPGKQGLLVIAAGAFGFFLILFIILALEYFDNTIRTPERLEELSKLKLAGTFPRVISKYKNYNFPFITNRLIELMIHNIRFNAVSSNHSGKPRVILVFSPMRKEGKTYLASRMAHKIREFGERTAFLSFVRPNEPNANSFLTSVPVIKPTVTSGNDLRKKQVKITKPGIIDRVIDFMSGKLQTSGIIPEPEPSADNFRYIADISYVEANNISGLNFIEEPPTLQSYKYIIFEIPGIIYHPYPMDIISQADVAVMVIRSNRAWKKADSLALATIIRILKDKPLAVLNGVEIEVLENILGELPKRRSHLRRITKQILRLQFHEKQKI